MIRFLAHFGSYDMFRYVYLFLIVLMMALWNCWWPKEAVLQQWICARNEAGAIHLYSDVIPCLDWGGQNIKSIKLITADIFWGQWGQKSHGWQFGSLKKNWNANWNAKDCRGILIFPSLLQNFILSIISSEFDRGQHRHPGFHQRSPSRRGSLPLVPWSGQLPMVLATRSKSPNSRSFSISASPPRRTGDRPMASYGHLVPDDRSSRNGFVIGPCEPGHDIYIIYPHISIYNYIYTNIFYYCNIYMLIYYLLCIYTNII